ncbi:histidine phosphatase family protein [Butyrivibrio sp. XPD2002]|uniref:histidine phosphatase family protein n=1 Tax=Butyrivibrio sp. XPD2002 TaxID=1280665 RepID=UPI00040E12C3|nr:histidine phosphatase family protein [Butyrivibrio sp. XPD2002]
MMIFYLVRHGQTDWNLETRLQGHANIPMNADGILQMNNLADKMAGIGLKVDAMISSPLGRAGESARIIADKIGFTGDIITDPAFIERDFGKLEGVDWNSGVDFEDPQYGVEGYEALCERAGKALHKYSFSKDARVMIVSHGAFLTALRDVLSDYKMNYWDREYPIIQGNALCVEVEEGKEAEFRILFPV